MDVAVDLIDRPGRWCTVRAARLLALRNSPEAAGAPLERAERFSEHDWRAEVARRVWFVAASDDDVLGLVAGAWSKTVDREVLLEAMWVAEHARRRGVGGALVDAVLAWAGEHAARSVALKVAVANGRAISLYRSHGFQFTAERGRLPRDPTADYVVLRTRLQHV